MNDYFAENALFVQTYDMGDLEDAIKTGHEQMPVIEVVANTDPNYIPPKPDAVHWHLSDTAKSILRTLHTQKAQIEQAVKLIRQCRDNGGAVYIAGNGGSSSTAAHMVNDLVKTCWTRAMCLTDNVPLLTAFSNDEKYGDALAYIIMRFLTSKDVLFCISVSGNSPNIFGVIAEVKSSKKDVSIIGLGSQRRGRLAELSTVFIEAQSEDYRVAEDAHLAVCHAIVGALAQ